MANSMQMIDKNCLPDDHILISRGPGAVFHYTACGLPSVYVEGALEDHPTLDGWIRMRGVQDIHHEIADRILAKCGTGTLGAAQFRFLRKEIGLTVNELCAELGLDSENVKAWENETAFAPMGTDNIVDLYKDYRKVGFIEFIAARNLNLAA